MKKTYNNLPILDLHGADRDYAVYATKKFIKENKILEKKEIVIVHGFGKGIIKNAVHNVLKNEKGVNYKLDSSNLGATIIRIEV